MENAIRIIRSPRSKENPYFMMNRHTAQDAELSWEARGMLAYLLSKPDDWEVRAKDLEQQCKRDKVYRILKELREAGYLTGREKYRNAKGHVQWTPYIVHERPQPAINPLPEKPCTEKPYTAEPYTEKPHILHNREEQNTEDSTAATAAEKPKPVSSPIKEKETTPSQELERAYQKASGMITFAANGSNYEALLAMVEAGVTPEQLAAYITHVRETDKRYEKRPKPLRFVAQDIGPWIAAQPKPKAKTIIGELPPPPNMDYSAYEDGAA